MPTRVSLAEPPLSIAVVGSGITGLSAAWLLSRAHNVTLYEKDKRLGGHANTIEARLGGKSVPIDTGFIVYNEATYPNFTALLAHLGVETALSDMSFAASRDGLDYSSNSLDAFLGRGRNLLSLDFWRMSLDLLRFYDRATRDLETMDEKLTLGAYLGANGYGAAFERDHLLPMAAAIWSSSAADMRDYPARAFIRFFENHGLLQVFARPAWRTIVGGSRAYLAALRADMNIRVLSGRAVDAVLPSKTGVEVRDADGARSRYDRVLIATHADQALALLPHADPRQRALLGAIPYRVNRAVLHTDASFMPRRREAWSSWNYVGDSAGGCVVTYWMNRLQPLAASEPVFVTLNASRPPARVLWTGEYEHPCFTPDALRAQREIWSIQGRDGLWFAGAWLGAGFHEDGLQLGLAAAEHLGGVRRPWKVPNQSGRLSLAEPLAPAAIAQTA